MCVCVFVIVLCKLCQLAAAKGRWSVATIPPALQFHSGEIVWNLLHRAIPLVFLFLCAAWPVGRLAGLGRLGRPGLVGFGKIRL